MKKLLGGLAEREGGIAGLQGVASGHWVPCRARRCPLSPWALLSGRSPTSQGKPLLVP